MKGFTKEVLILLHKPEAYYGKDEYWKLSVRNSVAVLIEFITKHVEARPVMLTSDEVAVDLFGRNKVVGWWNALPPEDCNFARRNCEGLHNMPEGVDFEEHYSTARRKYPIKGVLEAEDRFYICAKREKFVANELIKKCKFVVSFENQNNAAYRVNKHLPSNRAVFIVKPINMVVESYFGGQPIDVVSFTELHCTSMPLYDWRI